MADHDHMVLEHLHAIRRQIETIGSRLDGVAPGVDSLADSAQLERIGLKLDGLTFVLQSSFASVVQRLDSLDQRLSRLHLERV